MSEQMEYIPIHYDDTTNINCILTDIQIASLSLPEIYRLLFQISRIHNIDLSNFRKNESHNNVQTTSCEKILFDSFQISDTSTTEATLSNNCPISAYINPPFCPHAPMLKRSDSISLPILKQNDSICPPPLIRENLISEIDEQYYLHQHHYTK